MNMMEQVISIPEQEVITKDNATVTVDGVAFFQVFDAAKASYEVAHLEQAIIVLTMTNIRSVMGSMDLDQVLSHRDEINERLLRVVDAAVSPWGLKVNRIEIKDIVPPADLLEAIGRQMKAERVKRADILEAEGERQTEDLFVLKAPSRAISCRPRPKEAAFRDAEARERAAEAEAKATQMVSEAIAKGDVAALNYFIAAVSIAGRSGNSPICPTRNHHAADRGDQYSGVRWPASARSPRPPSAKPRHRPRRHGGRDRCRTPHTAVGRATAIGVDGECSIRALSRPLPLWSRLDRDSDPGEGSLSTERKLRNFVSWPKCSLRWAPGTG